MGEPTPPIQAPGLGVDLISDSPPAQDDPTAVSLAGAERDDLNRARAAESKLLDREQDRKERLKYAERVFLLLVCWLVALGLIIVAQGFHIGCFELSQAVVLALVGSTTVSVVGIFLIVANYLFPRAKRKT